MSLILSGTDGLSDVDGTAATPALRGTDANTGIFFPAADTIAFSEGGAEVARFDSSGNLGIGTASPLGKVHSYSSSSGATPSANGNQLVAESSTNAGLTIATGATSLGNIFFADSGDSADGFIQYDQSGRSMRFGAATAEKMRIDSSGNLGLGVTPSAWTRGPAFEVKGTTVTYINSPSTQALSINSNNYFGSGGNIYNATGYATQYAQYLGQHIWYTAASGTAGNAITFTQAMTLDASGNLLVGTTSGSGARFNAVFAGAVSGVAAAFGNGNIGNGLEIVTDGNLDWGFNAYNSRNLVFRTNQTERARIDSSGNLLVGTTSSSVATAAGFRAYPSGIIASTLVGSTSASDTFEIYSTGASAYRFYVTMDGKINCTSTTIAAISDQRLKENIQDLDVGLEKIMALKPRKFDWKENKGKNIKGDRGWIAQEFEQVFPDMISTWKDEPPEGESPYKAVAADLIPVLVKAIQEQQALIQTLTARITALESA